MILLRIILLFFSVTLFSQGKSPVFPYIQKNLCPGEYCYLGKWKSKAAIDLYQTEGSKTYSFTINKNETFTAVKGNVHVIKPGLLIVTDSFDGFKKGQKIHVLSYRGEGFYDIWHKGKVFDDYASLTQFWSPGKEKAKGILKEKPKTEWWVLVKTKAGQQGWLHVEEAYNKIRFLEYEKKWK